MPVAIEVVRDQAGLVFIHGFNSSSHGLKARQLTAAMAQLGLSERLDIPDLSWSPQQALAQLQQSIQRLGRPLLVGSSLGGYYATYLAEHLGLSAVLLNPAVPAHLSLFRAQLGVWLTHGSGQRWQLTEDYVEALAALAMPPPQDPQRYQVWLQTGDTTLNYRDAACFYQGCRVEITEGGDHSFQGFAERIPRLLEAAGFALGGGYPLDLHRLPND